MSSVISRRIELLLTLAATEVVIVITRDQAIYRDTTHNISMH